jgi:hypothetical protein
MEFKLHQIASSKHHDLNLKVILWLSTMVREEGFLALMFTFASRMHKVKLKSELKIR